MTDIERTFIVLGMPLHIADRQRLRRQMNHPLSAIVSDSVKTICAGCQLDLVIGPYSAKALVAAQPNVRVLCPWCAARFVNDHHADVQPLSLGNPESRFEPE